MKAIGHRLVEFATVAVVAGAWPWIGGCSRPSEAAIEPGGAAGVGRIVEMVAAGEAIGDGGPATEARLPLPTAVAMADDGSLYVTTGGSWLVDGGPFYHGNRVRKISPGGVITTVAGTGKWWGDIGDGHLARRATLKDPWGVAVARDGSICIADTMRHIVRKVGPNGVITTVAGDGWTNRIGNRGRYGGDGGPATKASLYWPSGLTVGVDGSLYISDTQNYRVRKVDRNGIITTVAGDGWHSPPPEAGGTGRGRYAGDGGPATRASLDWPQGLALGADGSLYIADAGNHRIRKVDPNGIMTTVAGDGWKDDKGVGRYSGDGGRAPKASLNGPWAVTVCRDGSLYIGDARNHRVRKVDPNGVISTVAGNGWKDQYGGGRYSGDYGPALEARLNHPGGVVLLADDAFCFADHGNHRIRKVDRDGIITTIAGGGHPQPTTPPLVGTDFGKPDQRAMSRRTIIALAGLEWLEHDEAY